MRAVPWTDEDEQQLSRLALSGCELSADVRIYRVGLLEAPAQEPKLRLKFERVKQASRPSLCSFVLAVPWANEAE